LTWEIGDKDMYVFDSCEEFIKPPCCMMTKRFPPPLFKMKRLPRSMVLREMLQEITFDYKKRILLDV